MKKSEKKPMSPRVPESAIGFYKQFWPSAGGAAEWVLGSFPGMYHAAIAEMRGKFTPGELKMLIDVANGSAWLIFQSGNLVGQQLPLSVYDSFEIYPGMYEEKWGVKKQGMIDKINGLSRFHTITLEIWAAGFWEGDYEAKDAIAKHLEALT